MPRGLDRFLFIACLAGSVLVLWITLVEAPSWAGDDGVAAPLARKLFYYHVPAAFVSFIAFGVALVGSIQYLRRRQLHWDHMSHAAIEMGVLFSAITLVTGIIWADTEWPQAWDWRNAKLVMVLVLFLLYTANLALRRSVGDPEQRARLGSVYAIASFPAVPLTWFAHRIFNTFPHPQVFEPEAAEQGIVTEGVLPIFVLSLGVFVLLFVFLYRWRERLLGIENRIDDLSVAQEVPA